jgi:hypothetical protein|tara:strand:- start:4729 stop:6015 length:1287 start_codon:yes stop_codon:yes gene_type:complete
MSISNSKTKLLLDFGGTDLKIATSQGNEPGSIKRVNVSTLLLKKADVRFYESRALISLFEENIAPILDSGDIGSVYIATQMGCGYAYSESETEAVTDAEILSWQSMSGEQQLKRLSLEMRHAAGNDLQFGSPIFTLSNLAQKYSIGNVGTRRVDTLGGLIANWILGYKTAIRHSTDAFSLGGYSSSSEFERLEMCLELKLPEVTLGVDSLGFSSRWPHAEVFAPVGDQQASLLGISLASNELAVNVGTGGQLVMLLDDEHSIIEDCQIRPYFGGNWITTKTHLPAGRSVAYYYCLWRDRFDGDFSEFLALSEGAENFKSSRTLVIDFAKLSNTRKSKNAAEALLSGKREDLPRALALGMGRCYAETYSKFFRNQGTITRLVFAGGLGTGFLGFRRTLADLLQLEVREVNLEETTMSGLAKLSDFNFRA